MCGAKDRAVKHKTNAHPDQGEAMPKRRHIEFARKVGWRVVRRIGLRVLLRPNGWRFLFGTLTPRHMGRETWNGTNESVGWGAAP